MANSDNRYEMLPLRELSKLSWVVRKFANLMALSPCERAPPRARALLPATRSRSSGPLGALLSSPALDVRLPTALQVL